MSTPEIYVNEEDWNLKFTGDEKRRLASKNALVIPLRLAVLGCVYVALSSLGLMLDSWLAWIPIWIVLGSILGGLNLVAHECVHSSLSDSRRLNRWVGSVFMATNLLNFTLHKGYHLKHHRLTTQEGDTQEDIGLYGYTRLSGYLKDILQWSTVFNPFFFKEWKYSVLAFVGKRSDFFSTSESDLHDVRMDFLMMLGWVGVLTTFALYDFKLAACTLLVPLLCFFPLILYGISLPEHYKVIPGDDALLNTRTVRSNALARFMFWNINHHTAHHAYPYVPFYRLPEISEKLRPHMRFHEGSYLGFHWRVLRSLLSNKASDKETA